MTQITVERDREFFDAGMAHASALALIASYSEEDDDAFQFATAAIEKATLDQETAPWTDSIKATQALVEVPRAPYAPTHASRADIRKAVLDVVAARSLPEEGSPVTEQLTDPEEDVFRFGIWWVLDDKGMLRDARLSECATEIKRLRARVKELEAK